MSLKVPGDSVVANVVVVVVDVAGWVKKLLEIQKSVIMYFYIVSTIVLNIVAVVLRAKIVKVK